MRHTARFNQFSDSQRHALDASRNLVIRANAGSGKTSVLIERVVQILAHSRANSEPLEITDIAAITFTRKAAAELQERLRKAFDEERAACTDADEKAFWLEAASDLSRATIGTIDSLCGRILREFHWELQGPERIEVDYQPLDAYDQDLLEQEAIARVFNRFGGSEEAPDSPERPALAWWERREGLTVLGQHLRALLRNPVEPEKIVAAHGGQPGIEERCRRMWDERPAVRLLHEERGALAILLREIVDILGEKPKNKTQVEVREKCFPLLATLPNPIHDAATLKSLSSLLLTEKNEPRKMRGFKEIETQLLQLQDTWAEVLKEPLLDREGEAHALQAADYLSCLLRPVHAEYLALCREANRYDFLTLARRTRYLLQFSPRARAALRGRYRFVMIDEFQDTNLLQWQILSYLVGGGPDELLDRDRLCIVGDPQQSIFRFRQADVRVFQHVHNKIVASNRHHGLGDVPMAYDAEPGARQSTREEREGFVALAENYRSLSPAPLLLMDGVFQYTFDATQHALNPAVDTFEVNYQSLKAGLKQGARGEVRYVFAAGIEDEKEEQDSDSAAESEQLDEELITGQVEAVAGEFAALWGTPRLLSDAPAALRWRDMAILLPSRSATLSALESALRRRQIPFVVFGGIGFWQRQEIRDLVHLASWLADPGDTLSLFVVLRSPLAFTSDSEILFLSSLGRGNLWRGLRIVSQAGDTLPESMQEPGRSRAVDSPPLAEALRQTWLQFTPGRRAAIRETAARFHRWRQRADRMGHADLLQRALEESAAYALYAVLPEGEQILANVQQFFDRVRGLEADAALGLGRLARRLREQVDELEKEGQASLAGEDDAVQIMTVHAAKGLEFPVVAVLKMEAAMKPRGPELMVEDQGQGTDAPGTLYVNVRHPARPLQTFTCQGLRRLRELDKRQEIAEKRRLFYVAGTRSSERLILAGRATKRKRVSWQQWFEDALQIDDNHRQAGLWKHLTNDWQFTIIGSPSVRTQLERQPHQSVTLRIDVDSINELSQTAMVAATQLENRRKRFKEDPATWWLREHLHLAPVPSSAGEAWKRARSIEPQARASLIGQLVHRLLMSDHGLFEFSPRALEQQAFNQAAALLDSTLAGEADEELTQNRHECEALASAACAILARLRRPDPSSEAICRLARAAGKTEVPFALALGRWVVRGRFDKLIPATGTSGFTLIDWKTGRTDDARDTLERYRPQMMLYALALARSGQAARVDGHVQAQLVMFNSAEIVTLRFDDATLQAFGSEIENDLLETDKFCESLAVAGQAMPFKSDGR